MIQKFKKLFLFWTITVLVLLISIELISFFALKLTQKSSLPSPSHIHGGSISGVENLRFDPLFGHTFLRNTHGNNFGFEFDEPFPVKPEKNKLRVGVFGGSVAANFYRFLGYYDPKLLRKELPKKWSHLDVEFISFSVRGQKFPQTHMVATYFAPMLDYAIFLGGTNEIMSDLRIDQPLGYPEYWDLYTEANTKSVEILQLRKLLVTYSKSYCSDSNSSSYTKKFLKNSCRKIVNRWHATLTKKYFHSLEEDPSQHFYLKKPAHSQRTLGGTDLYLKYAKYTHLILKELKLPHIVLLQPTIYIGKKFLTEFERDTSIDRENEQTLRLAYSLAHKTHMDLKSEGKPFYSLAKLFENERKTIFMDNCCHLNDYGRKILMRAIFNKVDANEKKPIEPKSHLPSVYLEPSRVDVE